MQQCCHSNTRLVYQQAKGPADFHTAVKEMRFRRSVQSRADSRAVNFLLMLMPISTQENKHGIGPDRNKIEPAHGLSVQFSVPV